MWTSYPIKYAPDFLSDILVILSVVGRFFVIPIFFKITSLALKYIINSSRIRAIHLVLSLHQGTCLGTHEDVIRWKHFPRYWSFVRGIHWSPVNSPQKGQWRGALMFSLIWAWTNGWVNNRNAGDLRHHRAHYDVIVMSEVIPEDVCKSVCTRLHYWCLGPLN